MISANTLFHFTDKFDNLVSILSNGFYPRYCLENWDMVFDKSIHELKELSEIAIPIVSFCDIPLSRTKNHVEFYGKYAIGLSKDWGKNEGISPVLYTYKYSLSSELLKSIFANILENTLANNKKQGNNITLKKFFNFISFLKPYEGILWRHGRCTEKHVRFYDEREWRFIPTTQFIYKSTFLNESLLNRENRKLESKKLSFEPKNVRYIIVAEENEIIKMANRINKIRRRNFRTDDRKLFATKIISMELISEDF